MPTDAGEPRPAPHPEPPHDLHERELPLVFSRGPWFRVHRGVRNPVFFGKSGLGRFNSPDGSYGILYAALDFSGAFIETFGWITGTNVVAYSELEERDLAEVKTSEPLDLVDLTGKGLARIGADGRLSTGDHAVSQRWSSSLFGHPESPDGILYRARHDPAAPAVALHERASSKGISAEPLGNLADEDNMELLARTLDHYGFGL